MFCVTETGTENGNTTVSNTTSTPSTPLITSPEPTYKPNIETLPPAVIRMKVKWDTVNQCQGYIYFYKNFTHEVYPCPNTSAITENLGTELCEERRCGKFLGFKTSQAEVDMTHKNQTVSLSNQCTRKFLTCKGMYVCVCLCFWL